MPTITQLPIASSVASGDDFVIVQTGVTKQALASIVMSFIESTIQITESQVTNLTTDLASKLSIAANLSDLNNAGTARQNLGFDSAALTNGQLYIGSTGLHAVAANITGGSGITVSNGAGSITISSSGAGTAWVDVTSSTQTLASNTGYVADRVAGNVTFTLPAVSSFGDVIYIVGRQNGWSIAQGTGQTVKVGSSTTTSGAAGSVASTNANDCISLICTVANTEWTANAVIGNLTIV